MDFVKGEYLWCEKYRPQTVAQTILPARLKDYFQLMVNDGVLQNMLLVGGAGTGKTTCAKAMCNELDIDVLVINASENGNIDTLRTTIRSFASTMSFKGKIKCVILDEADYLSQATMAAFRAFIEEFSNNCRFILTANFANKIIAPIKSRCAVIDFTYTREEKKQLVMEFDRRIREILEHESVEFDKKTLAQVIVKHFPDFRKIINELQRHSQGGTLSTDSVASMHEDSIKQLIVYLKDKNWSPMRKWVVENIDNDFHVVMRSIYDRMNEYVDPVSIPDLTMILAKYDYQHAFVVDKEINLVAMLTDIMGTVNFK